MNSFHVISELQDAALILPLSEHSSKDVYIYDTVAVKFIKTFIILYCSQGSSLLSMINNGVLNNQIMLKMSIKEM